MSGSVNVLRTAATLIEQNRRLTAGECYSTLESTPQGPQDQALGDVQKAAMPFFLSKISGVFKEATRAQTELFLYAKKVNGEGKYAIPTTSPCSSECLLTVLVSFAPLTATRAEQDLTEGQHAGQFSLWSCERTETHLPGCQGVLPQAKGTL